MLMVLPCFWIFYPVRAESVAMIEQGQAGVGYGRTRLPAILRG
jgi:hypothetical protein